MSCGVLTLRRIGSPEASSRINGLLETRVVRDYGFMLRREGVGVYVYGKIKRKT
jgi:hypothetical protein